MGIAASSRFDERLSKGEGVLNERHAGILYSSASFVQFFLDLLRIRVILKGPVGREFLTTNLMNTLLDLQSVET